MAWIAVLGRIVVAGAFVMSAAWKLRNPFLFRLSLLDLFPGTRRPLRWAPTLVASLEVLVATALCVPSTATFGAVSALAMLGAFSLALARSRGDSPGCGCWRPPTGASSTPTPYLARNAVLALVALGSVLHSSPNDVISAELVLAIPGLLLALTIMESATIVDSFLSSSRSLPSQTEVA